MVLDEKNVCSESQDFDLNRNDTLVTDCERFQSWIDDGEANGTWRLKLSIETSVVSVKDDCRNPSRPIVVKDFGLCTSMDNSALDYRGRVRESWYNLWRKADRDEDLLNCQEDWWMSITMDLSWCEGPCAHAKNGILITLSIRRGLLRSASTCTDDFENISGAFFELQAKMIRQKKTEILQRWSSSHIVMCRVMSTNDVKNTAQRWKLRKRSNWDMTPPDYRDRQRLMIYVIIIENLASIWLHMVCRDYATPVGSCRYDSCVFQI